MECDQWTVGEGFICFLNMAANVGLSYFATVTIDSTFYYEYLSAEPLMHILVKGEATTTFYRLGVFSVRKTTERYLSLLV